MMVSRSIEFPKELTNDLEVQEDDQTVVYRARAHHIFMHGLDIRGGVSFTKIIRTEMRSKKSWFPRKTAELVPVLTNRTLWTVHGNEYDNSIYFVSNGRIVTFGCSAHFGSWLKGKATSQNIILPSQLILETFSPILNKLLEIHCMVNAA